MQSENMIPIVEMEGRVEREAKTIFKVPEKTLADVNAAIVLERAKRVPNYRRAVLGMGAMELVGSIGEDLQKYKRDATHCAHYKGLGIEVFLVPVEAVKVGEYR